MKDIKKSILLLVLVFCCTSCMQETTATPISTYYGLLAKVNDFLSFCCFMLSNSNSYIGQVISRIYYVYFTLAKIRGYNDDYNQYRGSHENIWLNMNSTIQQKYGNELKQKRVKYDYDEKKPTTQDFIEDLSFIESNQALFKEIVKDIRGSLEENPVLTDDDDDFINQELSQIEAKHDELMDKIIEKIKTLKKSDTGKFK